MASDLDDLRAAFEHQIAHFGPFLYKDATTGRALQPVSTEPSVRTPQPVSTESPERTLQPVSTEPSVRTPQPVSTESRTESGIQPHNEQNMYDRISSLIPSDSPLHRMKTLEEVAHYVASTVLIELDETRINPVFGVGNPNADLLVIGEAPGAEEDKKGEPFVGRAGQLFNDILGAIGFQRQDVYIAYILKSRPPNNRDPLPDEIRAHIPILHKQIELIQPKLILCVGRTSGTSLLGVESTLGDLRGTFHDYHGIPVLVTYHPAALLRNSNWKRPTWEDVQLLRKRYDELTA